MSQESVYKALRKRRWIKAKDLAARLGISHSSIQQSLRKLYKWNFIERKELKYNQKWFAWRLKR